MFSDGFLNVEEFDGICKGLFRNDRGIVYSLDVNTLEHIFTIFDTKKVGKKLTNVTTKLILFNFLYFQDGLIDRQEFTTCWNKWIKTVCLSN